MYEKLFAIQQATLKVLANQKRLEIIQLLGQRELTVTEMVDMLGIRQANLSQHLALLREARVLETRRDGLKIYYRLTDQAIAKACATIRTFLARQYQDDPDISQLLEHNPSQLFPVVKDCVCGMRLSLSEATADMNYRGQTYYFCGPGCKVTFRTNPSQYIQPVRAKQIIEIAGSVA